MHIHCSRPHYSRRLYLLPLPLHCNIYHFQAHINHPRHQGKRFLNFHVKLLPLAEPSVPSLHLRTNAPSPRSARLPGPPLLTAHRKQCIVAGCQEHIAPTMWRSHMNLHSQGVFPGEVPTWWLEEHNLSVCTHCLQLVAVSRFASHLEKCPTNVSGSHSFLHSSLADSSPSENQIPALPSFDVVCELQCPTIRYIPHKARPAFARVLSDIRNQSAMRTQRRHG